MRNVHLYRGRPIALLATLLALGAVPAFAVAAFDAAPAFSAEPAAPAPPTVERGANTTRVAASLRYTDGSKSEVPVWSDIKVSIKRDDVQFNKDEPLPAAASSSFFSPPKLIATDLDDDADPEVLIDVFTAGYECCRRTVVYHREGERYASEVLEWDNTGYRLEDVAGGDSPEFISDDGRFAALFRSDEPGPIRVQSLDAGKVRDVTAQARSLLRRDAKLHRRAWKKASGKAKGKGDARPAVAAYVVDLIRLDQVRSARGVIASAAKRGGLKASANAFARRIDARLVAWGYASKGPLGRIR